MDDRFLEAILNRDDHVVLGRPLAPFSLWHFVNLDVIQSPVAGHPGPFGLEELAPAVLVCASRPDTSLKCIYPPTAGRARRRWLASIRPYRTHEKRELRAFADYQVDFSSGPKLWRRAGGTPLKTPWPMAAVARLMHLGHVPEFEAWTMPFGKALWYSAALAEAAGRDPGIVSEEEWAALREAGWNV